MRWGLDTTVWAVLAIVLVACEALIPGAALLWLGVAAGAVCLLVLAVPTTPFVVQALAFAVLSFLSIRYLRMRNTQLQTDQPALNRRAEQLVGRVLPLMEAIVDGRGRVQVADAFWDVEGPDLPAGTRVRVVGGRGMTLLVREVGSSEPTPE